MAEERTGQRTQTIGTSSTVVSRLQPYAQRVLFVLTNTSTSGQTITLAFNQDAVAGSGIVLSPGGFYSEAQDAGFLPTNMDIYGIASAGGATLAITERVTRKEVL